MDVYTGFCMGMSLYITFVNATSNFRLCVVTGKVSLHMLLWSIQQSFLEGSVLSPVWFAVTRHAVWGCPYYATHLDCV